MQRPNASVYSYQTGQVVEEVKIPEIFSAPIRVDIVNRAHNAMAKNKRQPHGVQREAGMEHSAASWGTGRAVARIPRISGSGTSRAGQGAFGNMCRKGRMFAPIRVWRKWGVKIPTYLKRYSVISAIAASSVPALVLARGHRVEKIKEIPLIVSNDLESVRDTKEARDFLKKIGAEDDRKAAEKKRDRAGRGKSRNRPYTRKRGPLIIYLNDNGICQSFRNIIGVETMWVRNMNILRLAPGGHVGRFIIWTKGAFEYLENFGSYEESKASIFKRPSGIEYTLPRSVVHNSDVDRIMEDEAVQNALPPKKIIAKVTRRRSSDEVVLKRLNPYSFYEKRSEVMGKSYLEKYGVKKNSQKMKKKV